MTDALIAGAGPAGLMAAERLAAAGLSVLVAEAKPSVARKFLMAGKSGLNLTREDSAEDVARLCGADAPGAQALRAALAAFGPAEVRAWAEALGQPMFTGSSRRVYPVAMKASPLLRAWLKRLTDAGVTLRTRMRWTGLEDGAHVFADGTRLRPKVAVLAFGGGSWPRLGSDAGWTGALDATGVPRAPFRPANMGFDVAWSPHMERHFGAPVKPVALSFGATRLRGEFVISRAGVEGSAIYALSAALRDACGPEGVTLTLDLAPDRAAEALAAALSRPRGKASLSNHLRKVTGLSPVALALLREAGALPETPGALAARIKATPLHLARPRPLEEAISSAGGLRWEALDDTLMLRAHPGLFCAGEMLDWEAPTGGYLLTACLATGRLAGEAAARFATRAGS
ncbi:TIGR03862 family flavoprotein [Paroceanicella profunda]|uniref:TIGR03862 family flavoprotein n=1 Tax=Paroceanicella profunda TaxID=2579971 RepID=A0A5B8FU57_9RHOB|nr:TIGR03862 family flavoprotein [Paroceanicella profunda]QDL92326.1 TIGR03862 family flavoprotein [Paroceanicella profunda]